MAEEKREKTALQKKTRQGGSGDEMELLREIILGNKGLMLRVLDKIKLVRATSKKGAFDDIKEKKKGDRPKDNKPE